MNKIIRFGIISSLIIISLAYLLANKGDITGYTVSDIDSTILEDIQIHADTEISPTLEITIPTTEPKIKLDKTYNYIEIAPIEEKYNSIDIFFKVQNSWIDSNKLEKTEVSLYLLNKTWEQLSTSLEKQDNEYTYYKARTQELGLFAIAKSQKELYIETQPVPTKKPISPLLIIIVILSIIFLIELLTLVKYIIKFVLITSSFATMILGLAIQQPITKEVLIYGLTPISIIAIILSSIITLILNKIKDTNLYSYIRNILISTLLMLIFIVSTTKEYNKEIIIYGILPLILLSILITTVFTLLWHINKRFNKSPVYTNIRNILISLIPISIFVKLMIQQTMTEDIFYFGIIPITMPIMIVLLLCYFKENKS